MAHREGFLITFSTRHSSQLKISTDPPFKEKPLSKSELYFLDLYHANVLTCFSQFRLIIAGVGGLRINFKFSFFLFNVLLEQNTNLVKI